MDNLKLIIENLGLNLNPNSNLWDKEFREFKRSEDGVDVEYKEGNLDLISIEEFFSLYDKLFYNIPKEGELNSHETLVNRSSEYSQTQHINSEIEELVSEITTLREEILNLKINEVNE